MKSMSPLEEIRHSASHVLATAVLRLFPETKLDIGPPTDNGFYYDIDLEKKLDAADLEAIESEMKKIIKSKRKFTGEVVSRDDAIKRFYGQEYKLEIIKGIPKNEKVTIWSHDVCSRVPYIKS